MRGYKKFTGLYPEVLDFQDGSVNKKYTGVFIT